MVAQNEPIRGGLQRAALDGIELEYELRGAGEPVVLVHAASLLIGSIPCWSSPP
jgi:hypothetical protein